MTADLPETLSQASTWEKVKARYLQAGACDRCAAQVAWGHQVGFARLEPCRCARCLGLPLHQKLIARHGMRGQRWFLGAGSSPGARNTRGDALHQTSESDRAATAIPGLGRPGDAE